MQSADFWVSLAVIAAFPAVMWFNFRGEIRGLFMPRHLTERHLRGGKWRVLDKTFVRQTIHTRRGRYRVWISRNGLVSADHGYASTTVGELEGVDVEHGLELALSDIYAFIIQHHNEKSVSIDSMKKLRDDVMRINAGWEEPV